MIDDDDGLELVGIMVALDFVLAQEALADLHQVHESGHDDTWEDCQQPTCRLGRDIQELLYEAGSWTGEDD